MSFPSIPAREFNCRWRALHEFFAKKPIEEAFKNLGILYGDDVIEYNDLEYLYKRFEDGNFELCFSRRLEENPNLFSEMTLDVFDVITSNLSPFERLIVRNVSRGFRSVIDKQFDLIKILDIYTVLFGTTFKVSLKSDNVLKTFQHRESYHTSTPRGWQYLRKFMHPLATFLKNPKLRLQELNLHAPYIHAGMRLKGPVEGLSEVLVPFMGSLDFQIHTKQLHISEVDVNSLLKVLKCMKPGELERLFFYVLEDIGNKISLIIKTEQWKQAKHMRSSNLLPVLIDELSHFETFHFYWEKITTEEIIRLRDVLVKSTNFESARLGIRNLSQNIEEIRSALGSYIFRIPNELGWRSYQIAD